MVGAPGRDPSSRLPGPTLTLDLRCDGATEPGCGYRHVQYLEGLPITGDWVPAGAPQQTLLLQNLTGESPSPPPVFSFFQRHRGSRLTHITNLPSIRGETKPIASRLLCLVCSDFPPLICFSVSHSFSIKRGTARPQFILFKACITRHARDRRPASFKLCSDPVSTCTRAARSVCFALIVL